MTSPVVVGDRVYLGNLVGNLHFWGILTDIPLMPSMEIVGNDGSGGPVDVIITVPVTPGPVGEQGEDSEVVKMQWADNLTSSSDLPELSDSPTDVGKAWWIGNMIWAWSGTEWFSYMLGIAGPYGPVPVLDFAAELVYTGPYEGYEDSTPIKIIPSGTPENRGLLVQFEHDSIVGPVGPGRAGLRDAADYDNTIEPNDGDAIVWYESKKAWGPSPFSQLQVFAYSVPQSNFTSYTGSASAQQVCAFPVPPQPFSWRPMVFGSLKLSQANAFFNLFATPLNLGCSVTLGDVLNGPLIARGFGNLTKQAVIMPHYSTPGDPMTAVSRTNTRAVVPAYHTGNAGTVYLSVTSDGAMGAYSFQADDAELLIMVVPTSDYGTAGGGSSSRSYIQPESPFQAALDALMRALGGTSLANVLAVMESFSGEVTSTIQNTLDAMANALGFTGNGFSVSEVAGYLTPISENAQSAVAPMLSNLASVLGGTSVSSVASQLSSFEGEVTSDIQNGLNSVANSLGLSGVGYTVSQTLSFLDSML